MAISPSIRDINTNLVAIHRNMKDVAMAKNIIEIKMGLRDRILVNRGEVTVSSSDILETHISTCVSVCLYHSEYKLGGITHISRSHEVDNTPSGKYIKTSGYYYADSAIPRLLYLFKKGTL